MLSLLSSLAGHRLPRPADRGLAELGLLRWRERAGEIDDPVLAEFMRALAAESGGAELLAALFGNSPFLTTCCLKEPDFLRRFLALGPDATFAEVAHTLNHDLLRG
ncbi:MAG TPA: hypothetical protein VEC75_14500, partial [Stellaceae bacterium]|nr:hypothetical protein [Stellaceae bacterium]